MTSPVDTSVKNFNSTMVNAPVLNGTAGSLIALLDACLVTGFDTKTLSSLVALGGVMTATFTGTHSAQVDSVVLIGGVTGGPTGWAGANGEQKVVAAPTAVTRTWATALPDGTYTGTITIKMAPLGWAKSFSGAGLAAYRSTDPASTGMYLRVDDTGTTFVRAIGYETMTDVDTGTGPFPTAAQVAGGGYWPKSHVANSTAVVWALFGDSRTFYPYVAPYSAVYPAYVNGCTRGFGDPIPLKASGDAYACMLSASKSSNVTQMYDGEFGANTNVPGIALARSYAGIGAAALHNCGSYTGSPTGVSGKDPLFGPFPSAIDGSLFLSKKYVWGGDLSAPRADIPGLYHCPQTDIFRFITHGIKTPGAGALSGRTLMALQTGTPGSIDSGSTVANAGALFVDITGPWRNLP